MLLGKIHRAKVTRADLDYVGSVSIDRRLTEAAGFLTNEQVEIYNITNGNRLATYVIPAKEESGEIGINGAAAHLMRKGDLVIIAAYGLMREKAARKHRPKIVFVDTGNRPVKVVRKEVPGRIKRPAAALARIGGTRAKPQAAPSAGASPKAALGRSTASVKPS